MVRIISLPLFSLFHLAKALIHVYIYCRLVKGILTMHQRLSVILRLDSNVLVCTCTCTYMCVCTYLTVCVHSPLHPSMCCWLLVEVAYSKHTLYSPNSRIECETRQILYKKINTCINTVFYRSHHVHPLNVPNMHAFTTTPHIFTSYIYT